MEDPKEISEKQKKYRNMMSTLDLLISMLK